MPEIKAVGPSPGSTAKNAELEARLKPESTVNIGLPLDLIKESDRQLWIQQAEMKAQLSELIRVETLKMFRDEIDGLQTVELVQEEYEQAIKRLTLHSVKLLSSLANAG